MAQQIPQAKMVPVASLRTAEWNPRTHTPASVENLGRSMIEAEGLLGLRPVLAMLDGTVFAGNMRLRAAQHLGWLEIPAILVGGRSAVAGII